MIQSRFSDAIWFKPSQKQNIVIGGVGGIGSWLALFIGRIGVDKIAIYDMDVYEKHNLGGQFAKISDIGELKRAAIIRNMRDFGVGAVVKTLRFPTYTVGSMSSNIMFSCFDNMNARKIMFKNWLDGNSENSDAIFIDGRLAMELMQIFCVQRNDIKAINRYQTEFLFSDDEVEEAACTLKQTSHSAAMIAGFMTSFYTNWLVNITERKEVRSVPFMTEYFIPINLMTYENKV